jgi:LmbE family N-acetylglucosaminyl deacetylase
MKALVIAAHPDDEVLGCGGTIARMAGEGHDVHIAIVGEGITSRYAGNQHAPTAEIEKLHQQCRQAARLLNAKQVYFFNFPDNRLDTVPLLEVIKPVEQLIEKVQPDTIYTHHSGDLNIDHQVVHRAVLTATRPMVGHFVKTLFTFEIPSSTDWSFNNLSSAFHPNTFVSISQYVEKKIEAMMLYESEAKPFPHPRSPEAIESIARRWGSIAGMNGAEAFELVRDLHR